MVRLRPTEPRKGESHARPPHGRHRLCRRLLLDGHEVHLLVRPEHTRWRLDPIRADVQVHELELHDRDAMTSTVGQLEPE